MTTCPECAVLRARVEELELERGTARKVADAAFEDCNAMSARLSRMIDGHGEVSAKLDAMRLRAKAAEAVLADLLRWDEKHGRTALTYPTGMEYVVARARGLLWLPPAPAEGGDGR